MPQPIMLKKGDPFTFTIKRGVGTDTCVSVNYDDFVSDVESGDTLLIDGAFPSSWFIVGYNQDDFRKEISYSNDLETKFESFGLQLFQLFP